VSCESCKEALETDGVDPDCIEGNCLIPPLDEQGQRILEIRDKLISLRELVDAGTILKLYDATLEDMETLAAVEQEFKEHQQSDSQQTKEK